MKKFLTYFFALLFIGFITSCSNDDETEAGPKPEITVTGIDNGVITGAVNIKAKADNKIESFIINLTALNFGDIDLAKEPSEATAPVFDFLGVNYQEVYGATEYTLTISETALLLLPAGQGTIPVTVTDQRGLTTSTTIEYTKE
ncbi:DUF4625 domain-containing protein [Flammeovirga yaeyamensis]|uniref:DUF4625 domain-containing protein n=2 Tax=Flammeovirga yaeyamensis TaxID=367791 RepID=A0AAX1N4B8_9BACT|nr:MULTISPECIES: hypothetical protein [Flammeovirga]ANQ50538.1 hypothetical protein MY04_3173 [Flammeovirga sp. MY04]MBB3700617.1 spore coat protein U-like protein [Flammeovirga yaeyamensis]NMF37733.1 hypothetical protein [Flammeovirga yaeyamensis]QWG02042.1 DUF4625 domain-containing protein [Flammeovirga yaeyamensis]